MKFEFGDRVRIIGPKQSQEWMKEMKMTIGLIGVVKNVNAMNRTYYVETYNPHNMYFMRLWYSEEWLAPAEEEKRPEDKIPKVCIDLFYTPKHIYKGDGKTVVMWEDGTKTIVKRAEGEPDNDYAAFTAALAIKIYGDNSKVNRIVRMTETVEKRKKKKKQKEAAEGEFEVIRWSVGENKSEYTVSTHHSRVDAEGLAAFLNAEKIPNAKYFVREKGEE